jgi:glycosyltransferase involved in cell wall biosynthesis
VETSVARLAREGHAVKLLRHQRNQGKGAALRTGFDSVLEGAPPDDDLVIIQDADLEYDPADYAALMEPLLRGASGATRRSAAWIAGCTRPPTGSSAG